MPLAPVPGTGATSWTAKPLRAPLDHCSAAAGHARLSPRGQPAVYEAGELGFLQLVANQVAVAVENALAIQ